MSERDRIDEALRTLGEVPVPPPSAALEAEMASLRPVASRSPRRGFVVVGVLSLAVAGLRLWVMGMRPDISGLPVLWLVAYGLAWLFGFVAIGWLAVVPPRGQVMPAWRLAGIGAALASVGFVVGGLLFHAHGPESSMCPQTVDGLMDCSRGCVQRGVTTALVPMVLGALLLRGRVPVGSRWAGAGLGAASGALGGLFLHLECAGADALHVGVVHGGVVSVAVAIGALVVPLVARR